MNKYIKILAVLFVAGSIFTSCDLDRFPPNSIAEPESLQTINDAIAWNNGIMSFFRGRINGEFSLVQDVQADQLNAGADFGNRMGIPHTWQMNAGTTEIRNIWFAYYMALANVNHLINSFPVLYENLTNAAEKAQVSQFLGNAHFARAFYYNELALRWSPSFDPATAATTLSVPLVTAFDVTARPTRATLEQVYGLILADIAEARRLLANVPNAQNATRFTPDAVTALEARVKLYMQDWDGAFAAANSLITSGRYPLVNTVAAMETMWVNDRSTEIILQMAIGTPVNEQPRFQVPGITTWSWQAANNNNFRGFNATTNRFAPDFLPSQWVVDKFDANDIRRPVYFSNAGTIEIGAGTFTGIYIISKFRGNPAIPGAATSYVQTPQVFRIAEMYLIAAEAAFNSTVRPNSDALAALNALRISRGLTALPAGTTGDVLKQEIRDERFRELAFEGRRLWDLRRWGLGVERRDPQNIAVLRPGSGFYTLSVPANHHMFVWGIPSGDVMLNPNLEQNKDW